MPCSQGREACRREVTVHRAVGVRWGRALAEVVAEVVVVVVVAKWRWPRGSARAAVSAEPGDWRAGNWRFILGSSCDKTAFSSSEDCCFLSRGVFPLICILLFCCSSAYFKDIFRMWFFSPPLPFFFPPPPLPRCLSRLPSWQPSLDPSSQLLSEVSRVVE